LDANTAVLVAGHNVDIHAAVGEGINVDFVDQSHILNLVSKLANIACKMILEPNYSRSWTHVDKIQRDKERAIERERERESRARCVFDVIHVRSRRRKK
jgi:hypothetical protein